MRKLFITILIALLGGCANLTSPARYHEIDPQKMSWLDYDASRRGTLVIPSDKNIKTCAEPAPDVALTLISKLEGSLKDKVGDSADAKAEFSATVVELGKRTQMVMFLREALFRLCEQSLNNKLDKTEIVGLYQEVIKAATTIVEQDKTEAEAKVQDAKNKAMQLRLQQSQ